MAPTQSQFEPHPVEKPPDPEPEVKPEVDSEISSVIEIPDDAEDMLEDSDLIEVVRKEIIEIRTTKIFYVKEKKVAERTKVKIHEHSATIKMTQAELDRKTSKAESRRIKLEKVSETVVQKEVCEPDRTITRRSPDQLPNLIKRPQIQDRARNVFY